MAEWSIAAILRICEMKVSEGSNPFFLREYTSKAPYVGALFLIDILADSALHFIRLRFNLENRTNHQFYYYFGNIVMFFLRY